MIKKSLFFLLFGSLLLSVVAYSQFSFADFSFSAKFGSVGTDEDEFDKPTDLAISNDGKKLYVVDSKNNRIKIFELTGGDNCPRGTDEIINDEVCFDDDFGSSGSGDGRFDIPTDLAINPDNGDIYVVDSENNRVQRFQSDGDFDNLEFGSSDNDDDEYLGSPSAIAVHKKTDYIYVADSDTDSISVFDDDGDFLFNFGDTGSDDDEFRNPSGMIIDNNEDILYVADTDNNRIQIFELTDRDNCPSGTKEVVSDEVCFVENFGSSGSSDGKFDEPIGLAFDTSNDLLYVADTENNRIQVFEIISGNTCPSGTSEIIDGVCFVEEFGSSGSSDGKFNSPSGLAFDTSNDLLYVADTDNHRVQMLSISIDGDSSSTSSSSSKVPPSPKNISAEPASPSSIIITWNAPELDDDMAKITGYKIESRVGSGSYSTIIADTKSTATSFLHTGLEDENYRYRVYAINSEGTSSASSVVTAKPGSTQTPSGLTATPISKNQILLSWIPPSDTFKQSITGYLIEREIIDDVLYEEVASVSGSTTSYTVSGLETGKTYTYVVSANLSIGNTPQSNSASATPEKDSKPPTSDSSAVTTPTEPRSLSAIASSTQIQLSWKTPTSDGNSKITGYKIEVKKDSNSYSVLESNTKDTATTYVDSDIQIDSTYTYRVSAINSVGVSNVSSEASATPKKSTIQISPLGKFTVDEKKTLSFVVKTTESVSGVTFSLEKNPLTGAKINSNTGMFTWTPNDSQGGRSYEFEIVAKKDSMIDKQSVTINVNDVKTSDLPKTEPDKTKEPEPKTKEPTDLGLAAFVDETKDPQYYVDRYNNEASYKKWFDDNYSEYSSIYEAVGLEEPKEILPFVDETKDPQYYVDRYNNEASYKKWFDDNYSEYSSIYEAVGLEEPKEEPKSEPQIGECGVGTELVDGVCTPINNTEGGGCLIATATYGSEMAPQVQLLREIRDGKVMSTESGASFMTGFNEFYYSFSPYVADYERQNPAFKELVKIGITPMLSTLSIMSIADTEQEILGYGIGVILMNIGMYVAAPVMLGFGINRLRRKVRF